MKNRTSKIAVVIPAYNEGPTIGTVVRGMSNYGDVIVVNDFSTDDTGALAQSAGAIVIDHTFNRGYDAALSTGLQHAFSLSYEIAVTADADGQHTGEAIERALSSIVANRQYDVVLGRRQEFQRVSERIYSWFARAMWKISDPLCGLKAYRLSGFLARDFEYTDDFVGTKFVALAIARGRNLHELSIVTVRRSGTSKFGSGLRANVHILRSMLLAIRLVWRTRRSHCD
jgi:glycosyltransferase involved in cell wall biosynthesis